MAAVPQDLLDRIRELERQVRELMGRANTRPALNEVLDGDVRIGEGGRLMVISPEGQQLMYIGRVAPPHGDGSDQQGLIIRREDGSAALTVWSANPTGLDQYVALWDNQGRVVVSDDAAAGGLARPWLPLPPPYPEDITKWASTTSSTFVTIATSFAIIQHPRMRITGTVGISGNTAELRVLVNGTAVATGTNGLNNVVVSVPNYEYGDTVEITWQLRRSAGTGTVWGQPQFIYGVQS